MVDLKFCGHIFVKHLRTLKIAAVMAFVTALVSGCSGGGAPSFDSKTALLMQGSLDAGVSEIKVPGVTMTVVGPDGSRWAGISGVSDIPNNTAMADNLKFRIGSVTKTFTATMILQLVQEGRLSLDQTLEAVLPGTGVANANQITIRQMLNHTSGIFDYAQAQNPNFLAGLLADPLKKWRPEDLIAVANANAPYFDPGKDFHYSNTNYVLFGLMVEKLTGRSYGQELSSRILVPLGMVNTSVPETPEMPAGSTHGYTYDNGNWLDTTRFDPSWGFGTGSLISNSEDLLIWLDALIQGTLLDQQRKADMFTFVDINADVKYGLGLENQIGAVGHTGDFVYGGQAAVYHINGWRFVVLTNSSPTTDTAVFGSEYIAFKTMKSLGLMQ